jgi:very-short-patch-repair endonuclease
MDWADQARRQAGTITRRQLRACGQDDSAITRLARSGAIEAQGRRVYLVRGAPSTAGAAMWAAVLGLNAIVGFASAAHQWGMDDAPGRIHVIVAPQRTVTPLFGVSVHRVFVPRTAVTDLGGLPITVRPWTLLDHLGTLPLLAAQRLADRALQRGWITRDDIARRLVDYPARQGNGILRRLHVSLSDGAAAASERLLHRILRRAGIAGWVANYPLRHEGRLVAVLDVAIPRRRLAIEIDGWAFHSDVDRFQRDRQRQNALVSLGWTVLRFTWADLNERPTEVARQVRRFCVDF